MSIPIIQFHPLAALTLESILLRVFVAIFLGGLIGIERERRNQAAGFRTYTLVCLGACLVMMTNQYVVEAFGQGDPTRLGAQVISGIGFLGIGTIIVTQKSKIRGLTTAAGLWTTACLGLAIGIGFYTGALISGLGILLVMTLLRFVERIITNRSRYLELYLELGQERSLANLMHQLRDWGIQIVYFSKAKVEMGEANLRGINLSLKLPKQLKKAESIEQIAALSGVEYVEDISS